MLRASLLLVWAGSKTDDLLAVLYSDCFSPEEPESSALKVSKYKKLSELLSEVREEGGFRKAGEKKGEKKKEDF